MINKKEISAIKKAEYYQNRKAKLKKLPYTVYKVGDRIAIAHQDISKLTNALGAYYESLSNFACKPIHKIVEIAKFETKKEAEVYLKKNYRDIKKVISPLHSGSNMQGLTEEKYTWDYRFTCPTCGKSGFPTVYWINNHFDNCIYKETDEIQEDETF